MILYCKECKTPVKKAGFISLYRTFTVYYCPNNKCIIHGRNRLLCGRELVKKNSIKIKKKLC